MRDLQLNQESAGALWSIREDFVAVTVTQAPMVYPLFGRQFWQTAYGSGSGSRDESRSGGRRKGGMGGSGGNPGEGYEITFGSATMNRVKRPKDPYSLTQLGITHVGGSESQEEMIKSPTNQTSGTTVGAALATPGSGANNKAMAGSGEATVVIDCGNKQPELSRSLSRSPREKNHDNAVVVQQTVSTTVAVCTEEQKRRDMEAWRKQPWEA